MAFGRDVDFHDAYPQSAYLDRLTGDIIWLYDEDDDAYIEVGVAPEENRADRERVASDLHRYLEIPGLDHGDHHDILRRFLHSEWTEDTALRARAAKCIPAPSADGSGTCGTTTLCKPSMPFGKSTSRGWPNNSSSTTA